MVLLAMVGRAAERWQAASGAVVAVIGIVLLATALVGISADGAARWVAAGAVSLQPSLILLPLAIMAFARRPDGVGLFGIGLAAAALALQPDGAMAGVLAASLAVLIILKPGRTVPGALAAATAAFLTNLVRPDTSRAAP